MHTATTRSGQSTTPEPVLYLAFEQCDRTRLTNRIKGLLASQGVCLRDLRDMRAQLSRVQRWDGSPLPTVLVARLGREWTKVELLAVQIRSLDAERRELLRDSSEPAVETARRLLQLRGIGPNSAWVYAMECCAWRQLAWGWLRLQPQSALSRWYGERFGQGSSRLRRIGIVALARELLIALWR